MRKMRLHKNASAPVHMYTIKKEDMNKYLNKVIINSDLPLWLIHLDIGKRVYEQNGVYMIENQEQFERRIG